MINKLKEAYNESIIRFYGCIGYFWTSFFAIRLFIRYVLDIKNSDSTLPSGLNWLGTPNSSLVFWGVLWGVASIIGMYSSINILVTKRTTWLFFFSVLLFIALHLIWSISFAVGWIFLHDKAGWLSMGTYMEPIGLLLGFGIGAVASIRTRPQIKIVKK